MTAARPLRHARRGNVVSIRPGLPIPAQREEDSLTVGFARCSEDFAKRSYELAQTEPNSRAHRLALHMVGISDKLPRNNLRLIVRPITPCRDWFDEAYKRFRVAEAEKELTESRWSLAYLLDSQDGGTRSDALQAARREADEKVKRAIEDALRVPTARKYDVRRKQEMVGKREWALRYRPDWQAMVDEDLGRYAPRASKPREVVLA